MITIKLFNVVHQGRRNQNTTFNIFGGDYGLNKDVDEVTLLKNIDIIKPKDVEIQKNTSLKIIYRRQ
jgi:hypothetical protein